MSNPEPDNSKPTDHLEYAVGSALAAFGYWAYLYDFSRYPALRSWRVWGDHHWIGLVFAVVGLLQIYSVWRQCRPGRRHTAITAAFIWAYIVAESARSDIRSPFFPPAIVLLAANIWLIYRLPPGDGLAVFISRSRATDHDDQ